MNAIKTLLYIFIHTTLKNKLGYALCERGEVMMETIYVTAQSGSKLKCLKYSDFTFTKI